MFTDGAVCVALSASNAARNATMEALSSLTARPKSRHSGSRDDARRQSTSLLWSLSALLRITGTKGSELHCDGVTG